MTLRERVFSFSLSRCDVVLSSRSLCTRRRHHRRAGLSNTALNRLRRMNVTRSLRWLAIAVAVSGLSISFHCILFHCIYIRFSVRNFLNFSFVVVRQQLRTIGQARTQEHELELRQSIKLNKRSETRQTLSDSHAPREFRYHVIRRDK
jgi:hypothetical protein